MADSILMLPVIRRVALKILQNDFAVHYDESRTLVRTTGNKLGDYLELFVRDRVNYSGKVSS